jgi:hypothetical protein
LSLTKPCSFAKATRLPQKVTAPMMPDAAAAAVSCASGTPSCALGSALSTTLAPATSADAAPPNPFSTATICGMAVIGTRNAITDPTNAPTTTPSNIHS